ncbi:hypothetical protein, partial [Deinococcus soli (ex Cha et al. 2016)]
MPFILPRRRRSRLLTLTLRAQTRETERVTLTLRASAAPGTYRVTLALRAQTAPDPARIYTLVLHAQTTGGASDPPLRSEVLYGQPPITTVTRLTLNGVLLDGISWQHTR